MPVVCAGSQWHGPVAVGSLWPQESSQGLEDGAEGGPGHRERVTFKLRLGRERIHQQPVASLWPQMGTARELEGLQEAGDENPNGDISGLQLGSWWRGSGGTGKGRGALGQHRELQWPALGARQGMPRRGRWEPRGRERFLLNRHLPGTGWAWRKLRAEALPLAGQPWHGGCEVTGVTALQCRWRACESEPVGWCAERCFQ